MSGMGSTQPREDNWVATWEVPDLIKKVNINMGLTERNVLIKLSRRTAN
jgi:hypothetical protein